MAIKNAAHLLVEMIGMLSQRAPAIVASAAHQMQGIVLGLHFGDGSHAELQPSHSRLIAKIHRSENPTVEAYLDDRAINLLFDLESQPVAQIAAASLDVRGNRPEVLAVWRTFQLLSQRASGLRQVQAIWRKYRDLKPEMWGEATAPQPSRTDHEERHLGRGNSQWHALEYLEQRHPEHLDKIDGIVGGTVFTAAHNLWDGHNSQPWWTLSGPSDADLMETMERCKSLVYEELERIIPDREPKSQLYDQIRDYPARGGKGLRPTLTIATCCALGGRADDAKRSAASIELFHNGFLVHDDISDESDFRRNRPTLHQVHGIGLAVNTGDAMNLLAVDAMLSNLVSLGLARTLGLIHEIMHMCRETVEGQAVELGWIRNYQVPSQDEDYFNMSTKKTGWYTCISPCRIGAVCAGETNPEKLDSFNEAFQLIGIAFQIQDDVLNLVGEEELYGKEPLGDLLEGKRTVMLIHVMREADETTRKDISHILHIPRAKKTQAHAQEILAAMKRFGAIEYAIDLADKLAHKGVRKFEEDLTFVPETEGKAVLRQIANYVTTRAL